MPRLLGPFLLSVAVLMPALTSVAWAEQPAAKQEGRAQLIKKVHAVFSGMKGVYKARMSGCRQSDCDEASIYFSLPGKIDIRYDKPYGSRVVSDGRNLRVYNKQGDQLTSDPLAETSLGTLVDGPEHKDIEVASIELVDRGPKSPDPRRVYRAELIATGQDRSSTPITVYFAKKDFRLLGWSAGSGRRAFSVRLRDLRPLSKKKKLPKRLFKAISLEDE